MRNIFQRSTNLSKLENVPLSDYKPYELAAYVTKAYPGDPIGALNMLSDNHEIGTVLYTTTKILVEGLQGVKRD